MQLKTTTGLISTETENGCLKGYNVFGIDCIFSFKKVNKQGKSLLSSKNF